MKLIFCLLSFFTFISIELNAQSDSLITQDSPEMDEKNSRNSVILDLKIDTTYYPPFILPIETDSKPIIFKFDLARFDSGCNAEGAKKDLKNGKAFIWFPGGIVGCDFSSKADQEFQNRYQVQFVSLGCIRWGDEDPEAYNQIIFQHLDKKYGIAWCNELRHDAEGFTPPKTTLVAEQISLTNSPLAMQLANPVGIGSESLDPEAEVSVWWYILPTSGFALLLSFYFIKKKKDK